MYTYIHICISPLPFSSQLAEGHSCLQRLEMLRSGPATATAVSWPAWLAFALLRAAPHIALASLFAPSPFAPSVERSGATYAVLALIGLQVYYF